MIRRSFITLLGGTAVAWPLTAAWAQQPGRMQRIGVLVAVASGARSSPWRKEIAPRVTRAENKARPDQGPARRASRQSNRRSNRSDSRFREPLWRSLGLPDWPGFQSQCLSS